MEQIIGRDTQVELNSREVPFMVFSHRPYSDLSKSVDPVIREKMLLPLLEETPFFFLSDPLLFCNFVSSHGKSASFYTKEMSKCTWQVSLRYRLTRTFLAIY